MAQGTTILGYGYTLSGTKSVLIWNSEVDSYKTENMYSGLVVTYTSGNTTIKYRYGSSQWKSNWTITHETIEPYREGTYKFTLIMPDENKTFTWYTEFKRMSIANVSYNINLMSYGYFKKPTTGTFVAEWNDGSIENVSVSKLSYLYTTKSSYQLDYAQISNGTVLGIGKHNVYLQYLKLFNEETDNAYFARVREYVEFEIKEDETDFMDYEQVTSSYYGNTKEYYLKTLAIIQTMKSGDDITDNSNVICYIKDSSGNLVEYALNPSDTVYFESKDNGTLLGVLASEFCIKPNVNTASLTFDTNNCVTSVINGYDAFDLSNLVAYISYSECSYVQKVTVYGGKQTYSSDYKKYYVSLSNYSTYVADGSTIWNDTVENSVNEVTANIYVKSIFDSNTNSYKSGTIKIHSYKIDNITEITLANSKAFSYYSLGDEFINSEPVGMETTLNVTFTGGSTTYKKQIKAKDIQNKLIFSPLIGTKLKVASSDNVATISVASNKNLSVSYTYSVIDNFLYSGTDIETLRAVKSSNNITSTQGDNNAPFTLYSGTYLLFKESDTEIVSNVRKLKNHSGNISFTKVTEGEVTEYFIENTTIKCYGYLFIERDGNAVDTSINARVVLFNEYRNPTETFSNNAIVKFPCYVEGNADLINKCHFGKLFGSSNYKNRLFVSGNEKYANFDWHSGSPNTSNQSVDAINVDGDFTYISDQTATPYGQTDNKIMGYEIVSTSKMIAMKSKSNIEPTAYYVTPTTKAVTNVEGIVSDISLEEEAFTTSIGNARGSGLINHNAITSFNGDTVYISSDNTLEGLDVSGSIGDMQRISSSRSTFINNDLKKQDLSNAFLWSDNTYLYLVHNNGMYVAHFRKYLQKSQYDSSVSQYEWWKTDVAGVTAIVSNKDRILFGTKDGRLLLSDNGMYKDVERREISVAKPLSVDSENDKIIVAKDYLDNITDDCTLVVEEKEEYENNIYYEVFNTDDVTLDEDDDGYAVIKIDDDVLLNSLSETSTYYLNHKEGSSYISSSSANDAMFGMKMKLSYLSDGAFSLTKPSGVMVTKAEMSSSALCRILCGEFEICDVDKTNGRFSLKNNGQYVNFTPYGKQNLDIKTFPATLLVKSPVKAYYITAPMTMGTISHNKTIWSWTLSNDSNSESELEVCQATNNELFENMQSYAQYSKMDYGYSFGGISFSDVSFNMNNIPHKLTYYRPLVVPFICFGFRSLEPKNSVLCSMQVTYNVSSASYGDR